MGEVQLYQHIGSLCRSTDELMKLYPWATQYVMATDYAKLEAEAQALREELARIDALANCGSVQNWLKLSDEDKAKWFELYCRKDDENVAMRRELEERRTRVVVVPDRRVLPNYTDHPLLHCEMTGFNNCLDEVKRLNGRAVSEGLLREAKRHLDNWLELHECECESGFHYCGREQVAKTHRELRALLGEGKEHE